MAGPGEKLFGSIAEHEAMKRLFQLGLSPYHVFGLPHDIQIDRVFLQVKASRTRQPDGAFCFRTQTNHGQVHGTAARRYTPKDADFVLAWIASLDVWYVLPREAFVQASSVRINPDRTSGKYEIYRERWDLVQWATGTEYLEERTV